MVPSPWLKQEKPRPHETWATLLVFLVQLRTSHAVVLHIAWDQQLDRRVSRFFGEPSERFANPTTASYGGLMSAVPSYPP